MPQVDVLIAGSGSAGLCAATYLARCGVRCTILERRDGPMKLGQADGVQVRTVEIFESFGLSDQLLREAYHVHEVVYWADSEPEESSNTSENELNQGSGGAEWERRREQRKGIWRTGRSADTEPGLSHLPHVILSQARINEMLIKAMRKFNRQEVEYGWEITGVHVDLALGGDNAAYPINVTAIRDGKEQTFKARYLLGCDGAHSIVRHQLRIPMLGDSSDVVWGVMDIFPLTNFPDIRKKAAIRTSHGSLLIIPREGGAMVRFYIEMPSGTVAKEVTLEDLHERARRISTPYEMGFAETRWWSAYAIGQRVAERFTEGYRVFLTGDAGHTHSPKAGQGMNVSLQDGYNIGWKLAALLKERVKKEVLETFVTEREDVARKLIEFDRYISRLTASGEGGVSVKEFQEGFVKSGRYMAGLMTRYEQSVITMEGCDQSLAKEVEVGKRMPSYQVVRWCDAKPVQLAEVLASDGRWRLMIFAGVTGHQNTRERLNHLGDYLSSPSSPVSKYMLFGEDEDSFIESIVILADSRTSLEMEDIHKSFLPVSGPWKMRDIHKILVDDYSYNDGYSDAYCSYGIDPDVGALVIVRPDQYVSAVLPVEAHEQIGHFFDGFCRPTHEVD